MTFRNTVDGETRECLPATVKVFALLVLKNKDVPDTLYDVSTASYSLTPGAPGEFSWSHTQADVTQAYLVEVDASGTAKQQGPSSQPVAYSFHDIDQIVLIIDVITADGKSTPTAQISKKEKK